MADGIGRWAMGAGTRRAAGFGVAAAVICAGAIGSSAIGQEIAATYAAPTLDRWMYPFNGTPGTRADAATFGALGNIGFDNRDSQVIFGWDTAGLVTPGLGEGAYQVRSARVTVEISRELVFAYDPSFDALETYFAEADPGFVADGDAGRPLEMYALGYRGGFSLGTFAETTPFHNGAPFPFPSDRLRNAFAANFDSTGEVFDISNNAQESRSAPTEPFEPFEVRPLSVARTGTVPVGQLVPAGTLFSFDLDLSDPNHRAYIAQGLDAGRLNVVIATLHGVSGQGDTATPAFTMKEDPFGTPAQLEVTVCLGSPADLDCSGGVDVFDLLSYLDLWFAGDADLDGSGATDVFDLLAYLDDWFVG